VGRERFVGWILKGKGDQMISAGGDCLLERFDRTAPCPAYDLVGMAESESWKGKLEADA
jgi:hypothetical protein